MSVTAPLLVDGFTHGGEGVVRLDGRATFVPGALPGELVRVRETEDNGSWGRAELVEVVAASDDRVTPPCPYIDDCGGCDLQHATGEAQRRLKTRVVREQLTRLGKVVDPPVADCLAVGPDTGYRTHAQFHAGRDGRWGFHRAGTHDVVPIDTCLVLTEGAQSVKDEVGPSTGAVQLQVRGPSTGQRAAVLHPGPGPMDLPEGAFDLALAQPDGSTVSIRGDGRVVEQVAGIDFAFAPSGFFQVNTGGAEAIVRQVLDAVGSVDGAVVWDLYAGVGLISLPLARAGATVTAVEGDPDATEHLWQNAETAGLELDVVTGAVSTFVASDHEERPEIIMLDPPRAGAGRDLVRALAALAPATIVYVSCDPAALARDTRALADAGYRMTNAQPLDLFPQTHHVEIVATFHPSSI